MRVTINKNEREKILSLYRTEDLYSFEHNISRFTSLLESTIGDVKPLIIEQNEIKEIERETDPFHIANWLRRSPGTFDDHEAWAEAAFNQIANYTEYQKVAKELKQDPYKFCKSFMDVTKRYHKNSIENHYNKKIWPTIPKSTYKPTQQDKSIFNYPSDIPVKATSKKDWTEKAAIYLGYELELIKSQKGWGSQPCQACSTTISGSLNKDIQNKKLCLNSNVLAKTWKCPEGYSFYSVMARDYGSLDWSKMSSLAKSAPKYKDVLDRLSERIKKEGWGVVFEAIREAMTSAAGAAAQIIIDIFGGGIAVEIVWGILLAWDAYQAFNGNFNIVNLLTDIIGIVTFGPGGKFIWDAFKKVPLVPKATADEFAIWLEKNPMVKEYLNGLNFSSVVENTIGKVIRTLQKDELYGFLIANLKLIYKKVFGYIEAMSGSKIVAKAAKKGVEKYASKKGGKSLENTVADFADQSSPGSSDYVRVIDKTSSLLKAATK